MIDLFTQTDQTETRDHGPADRYSDADLQGFRLNVLKALDDARNGFPAFIGDSPERQAKHIQLLEAALERIEKKTYGICRVTGKLISRDRLRLVPHATLHIQK